ncbi:DUF4386 family protein [bacterium]|nr:DUF4386 family protein [bacterium]
MTHSTPSHNSLARWVGALLLLMTVTAIVAEFLVRGSLVVPGEPAVTITNLKAHPGAFKLGLFGYTATFLLDVPVSVLFYLLFRHVNKTAALTCMAFRLVYTAMVGAALLLYAGSLQLLLRETGEYALSAVQADAFGHFLLMWFGDGFSLSLVFFGFHLVFLGWLVFKSEMLPRFLGLLVLCGGVSYVIDNSFRVLLPGVQTLLSPLFIVLGMVEILLAVWLIVKGVKVARSR